MKNQASSSRGATNLCDTYRGINVENLSRPEGYFLAANMRDLKQHAKTCAFCDHLFSSCWPKEWSWNKNTASVTLSFSDTPLCRVLELREAYWVDLRMGDPFKILHMTLPILTEPGMELELHHSCA
jgi:hypothetical protein